MVQASCDEAAPPPCTEEPRTSSAETVQPPMEEPSPEELSPEESRTSRAEAAQPPEPSTSRAGLPVLLASSDGRIMRVEVHSERLQTVAELRDAVTAAASEAGLALPGSAVFEILRADGQPELLTAHTSALAIHSAKAVTVFRSDAEAHMVSDAEHECVPSYPLPRFERQAVAKAQPHRRVWVRVLSSGLRSPLLLPIWGLEALNYAVHVILRPAPWNVASQAVGYLLWALQLACFFRCQLVPPPEISDEWRDRAAAGLEEATTCPRTGQLLPPRARHLRRSGAVILGFDHYCFWLGTPIGLHNRKYFVLFVCWSAVFCFMGTAHSLFELTYALPLRLALAPFPWRNEQPLPVDGADTSGNLALVLAVLTSHSWLVLGWLAGGAKYRIDWLVDVFQHSAQANGALYTTGLFASAVINPLVAIILAVGGYQQAHTSPASTPPLVASLTLTTLKEHPPLALQICCVLTNSTTLDADDDRYNVGYSQASGFESPKTLWDSRS